ncbi:MAG: aminopeptidase P family protein [Bacteroidales bacterium]|nr:aminopeptidase P family protein [Bacteroidales bacterium]
MFKKNLYISRRKQLRARIRSGIILIPGNTEAAMNYPANTYHFRQDSNFLYYFGLDHPDLIGVIDVDRNEEFIFGNDTDMEDIIWMGPQPTMKERAAEVGIDHTDSFWKVIDVLAPAVKSGRKIHFLPTYRGEQVILLHKLLGLIHSRVNDYASPDLVRAVVEMRSVKDRYEVTEIEKAVDIAYDMFTTAMKMAHPGVYEREIVGVMEGISVAGGRPVSFPIILSINGQTLHNHKHDNRLITNRMLVMDAGSESEMHYASDITRTVPVGGKFSAKQKEIYQIVLKANLNAIEAMKPGVSFKEVHLLAARTIAQGLKDIGLMKGNVGEAVAAGAHALFFPHGLGHMLGLDVHDMEGLGENNVGYDHTVQRSEQFGLAYLRMAKILIPGFVLTIEPGIYFIPELIDQWKKENRFPDFIHYEKLAEYMDIGGVRIEDDVLVTPEGHKVLGRPIPKTVNEIVDACRR